MENVGDSDDGEYWWCALTGALRCNDTSDSRNY